MTDPTPQQALIGKVLAAAKESGYVQKSSTHGQGYKFAGDEAVTAKFREALIGAGLVMFPEEMEVVAHHVIEDPEGKKQPTVLVTIRQYFVVTDGLGATLRVASLGMGMDRGDKAIYKAMTGAKKYAYRHLVMMATGDDPENESDEEKADKPKATRSPKRPDPSRSEVSGKTAAEEPASKAQQDELKALAEEHGLTKGEMSTLRQAHTDKEKSSQFTVKDYEAMKAAIVLSGQVKAAAGEGAEIVK